jgi:hypothetical protein
MVLDTKCEEGEMSAVVPDTDRRLAPGSEHTSAADSEHIAFACVTQLLFDISDTVDRIAKQPT